MQDVKISHRPISVMTMEKNLSIKHADVGGISRRTLSLDIRNGCNIIQTLGQGEVHV
jgi:hypothetical protein